MTDDRFEYANLHEDADRLRLAGDFLRAIPLYRRALALARAAGDLARAARIGWGLGHSLLDAKELGTAVAILRSSERDAEELGDHALQAAIGDALARCVAALGDQREVLLVVERAQRAASRAEAAGTPPDGALRPSLSSLEGDAARALGDVGRALDAYGAAALGYELVGDINNSAAVRRALADTHSRPVPSEFERLHDDAERLRLAGDYLSAVPIYRRALALARAAGDLARAARIGWGLGLAFQDGKELDTAVAILRSSERDAEELGDHALQAAIGDALARCVAALGDQREVLLVVERAQRAASRAEAAGTPPDGALRPSLSSLEGDAARALGDVGRALDAYGAAALGYELVGDINNSAAVRRALADTHSRPVPSEFERLHDDAERLRLAGDYLSAVPIYRRALALARAAGDLARAARIGWGLGLAFQDGKELDTAVAILRSSERDAEELGDHALQAAIGDALARCVAALGDQREVLLVVERAQRAASRAGAAGTPLRGGLGPSLSSLEGDAARSLGDIRRALDAYGAAALGYDLVGDTRNSVAVRRAMSELGA